MDVATDLKDKQDVDDEKMDHLRLVMSKALVTGIILNINSYLSVYDSVTMTLVNKEWKNTIPDKTVLTCHDWHARGEYQDADKAFITTKVGMDNIGFESIHLKVTWKDQGWGNQKGCIILKLLRDGKEIARCKPFGIAAREWKTQSITLTETAPDDVQGGVISKSDKNDLIEIWRYVGGGGGHELFIKRFIAVFTFKHKPQSS